MTMAVTKSNSRERVDWARKMDCNGCLDAWAGVKLLPYELRFPLRVLCELCGSVLPPKGDANDGD